MKRTLFDNYYSNERFDFAKQDLIEIEDGNPEPTDSEVFDRLHFLEEFYWNDFKIEFTDYLDSLPCGLLCIGSVERWNGCYDGGAVITEFNDLYKLWGDCDYIAVYDKDGHLYINCSHHDGSNSFELKELTETGYNIVEDWATGYGVPYWEKFDERELHQKMWNSTRYTHIPHYAKKVWGCKTK